MPPKRPVARRKPPAAAAASSSSAEAGPAPSEDALPTISEPIASSSQTDSNPVAAATTESAGQLATSSTPTRPTRLTSLNQPSIGSPAARGKATIPRPKFSGRRSQAARAEAEREQAEQKAKEQADLRKRLFKRDGRGRGGAERGARSGRGRGGYMGESDRPTSIASGPFSAGQASDGGGWNRRSAPSSGGIYLGGGGGAGGSSYGGGSRSGARMGTSGIKYEDGEGGTHMRNGGYGEGGYVSSDDDDGEKDIMRRDVDNLVVIDLTHDEQDPAQTLAPFRIPRQAHKDRTIGVSVDGAASADAVSKEVANESGAGDRKKGKQRGKEVEIVGERERFHGTYSSSETDGEHIKQEPVDDDADAAPAADGLPVDAAQEPPSSPESRRKFKEQAKARTFSDVKPQRPLLQTQEEIEEWNRQQRDLDILRSELGTLALPQDQEGDINMENGTANVHDKRADKVYLFQFPPVLPDLVPIEVKPDPDAPPPEDRTGAENPVPNMSSDSRGPDMGATVPSASTERQPRLPTGAVGKLRIHKSGKATLDWGGTSLSLSMGTNASFLQDVIIATLPDQKAGQSSDDVHGVAMGMGQVKGKFVVTPDWEALLQ